jgi:hypothetical protein
MFEIMLKDLPEGSYFTGIFDCCHSGSALDLPFVYRLDNQMNIKLFDNLKLLQQHGVGAVKAWMDGDKIKALKEAAKLASTITKAKKGKQSHDPQRKKRTTKATVVQFSGCMDDQTSADTEVEGEATGALSWAFAEVFRNLEEDESITYTDLLKKIRVLLKDEYTQVPQMSSGYEMDMNSEFILY